MSQLSIIIIKSINKNIFFLTSFRFLLIFRITNGEQGQGQINITKGAQINVSYPVILLVGKTGKVYSVNFFNFALFFSFLFHSYKKYLGAGKSTLGNLLLAQPHDEGPFCVSADMVMWFSYISF
jgi:hypothetical protein